MENWELDFEWLKILHFIKDTFQFRQMPTLQSILYLIGLQELGRWDTTKRFTKEEKQDLIHVAICTLLESKGYYLFEGRDEDGWPHWKKGKPFKTFGVEAQEKMLKKRVIEYFQKIEI